MHNQPYVGRITLCTRKKLLKGDEIRRNKAKGGEIRHFYGSIILLTKTTARKYSPRTL